MNPNTKAVTSTGIGTEEVPVSSQYRQNKITILGLDEGILTVRAKDSDNIVFEDVINGELRLESKRTLTIRNVQIKEFEFAVTPEAAYTVKIKQTDADTER